MTGAREAPPRWLPVPDTVSPQAVPGPHLLGTGGPVQDGERRRRWRDGAAGPNHR
jgi:hypothetical protein